MSLILLARIVAPHGIKGQVKLKGISENLTLYRSMQTADGRVFEFTRLIPAKDHFIATLKGVTDRNQSESLKNTDLYIRRETLPATDEPYLADLIGRTVVHDGAALGTITGFQNFGAGELMEMEDGILIPVRFIETMGEIVTVGLPDGFLDKD